MLLVKNKWDEGQNAQIYSFNEESQNLERKTLAATSGHANENVVVLETTFNDCFLVVLKLFYLGKLAENIV